jgi:hypothetical protein
VAAKRWQPLDAYRRVGRVPEINNDAGQREHVRMCGAVELPAIEHRVDAVDTCAGRGLDVRVEHAGLVE